MTHVLPSVCCRKCYNYKSKIVKMLLTIFLEPTLTHLNVLFCPANGPQAKAFQFTEKQRKAANTHTGETGAGDFFDIFA